jgi:hypothetical protein
MRIIYYAYYIFFWGNEIIKTSFCTGERAKCKENLLLVLSQADSGAIYSEKVVSIKFAY